MRRRDQLSRNPKRRKRCSHIETSQTDARKITFPQSRAKKVAAARYGIYGAFSFVNYSGNKSNREGSPARVPCSVTYEFRVIRWANSGSSCARGFCPRARQGKREEGGRWRERNGYREYGRRAKARRERIKRAKRQGRTADARERSGKSPCGGGPPDEYSGVGDRVGVVDADGWWDGGRKEGSNYLGSFP